MVQERTCDYTGEEIEPGTGKMYVKTDGTILWFKDAKAEKNYFLGRESRDLEWIGYEDDDETATEDEAAVETTEDTEPEAEDTDADGAEADSDEESDGDAEETEADDEETEAEA
ncbi:large subunit ribosomal protein L24e [Halovenus aranensis]|jgi:large subunit ribosomal protein L24e|uniref:Large subunit ribosomal protein L24e n=1 Tax=Halovenus aranensis TaxID=890420 RepID=A0A1G8VBU4_9EURY|nr:50S ribosomal protein L24e [Halovenus aranensis]SDJ63317.1 large subunit ribosomal protein L24e [Halovenus aranensis]